MKSETPSTDNPCCQQALEAFFSGHEGSPSADDRAKYQELLAAATLLQHGLQSEHAMTVPATLMKKIIAAVEADRARTQSAKPSRILRRSAAITSLAASIALLVWYQSTGSSTPNTSDLAQEVASVEVAPPKSSHVTAPPNVERSLQEASSAFAGVTRQANESLLPTLSLFQQSSGSVVAKSPTATNTISTTLPQAASDGLKPITNTAKRAFQVFVRDLSLLAPAKRPS